MGQLLQNALGVQAALGQTVAEERIDLQQVLAAHHVPPVGQGEQRLDAIQFNFSAAPGTRIRAAYRLAINDYNGVQTPQLMIEHIENL